MNSPALDAPIPLRDDLRGTMILGGAGIAVLVLIMLLWAMTTMIGGAVIAQGQAVVRGKRAQRLTV